MNNLSSAKNDSLGELEFQFRGERSGLPWLIPSWREPEGKKISQARNLLAIVHSQNSSLDRIIQEVPLGKEEIPFHSLGKEWNGA